MYRLGARVRRVASLISSPTLIVHARADDLSNLRNAHELADRLGGPVELRVLEDSYHMVHVDKERASVADMTASFFDAAIIHGTDR